MAEHFITPPLELVEQLRSEAPHGSVTRERHLAIAAYRAGADAELEACCKALEDIWDRSYHDWTIADLLHELRAARRPRPPSLAEQALDTLKTKKLLCFDHSEGYNIIHRALKRLQELEQNNG